MIVIIGQSLLILSTLGVSLSGLLSTHACLLATVRILLHSSLGSLYELIEYIIKILLCGYKWAIRIFGLMLTIT